MLVETDAIILRTIKYSETCVIAHIYTEQYGKGSYLMNGVRKNHSKMALFQPMSIVHITAYRQKDPAQIHRIKDVSFVMVPTSIVSSVVKSTVALFVGEITDKVFREEEHSSEIFDFIKSFVHALEFSENDYANLHILYLLNLTRYLGVFPLDNYNSENQVFSILRSQFVPLDSEDGLLTIEQSSLLRKMLNVNDLTEKVSLTQQERQTLLSLLLLYYDVHICKTETVKSLEILKMVFE